MDTELAAGEKLPLMRSVTTKSYLQFFVAIIFLLCLVFLYFFFFSGLEHHTSIESQGNRPHANSEGRREYDKTQRQLRLYLQCHSAHLHQVKDSITQCIPLLFSYLISNVVKLDPSPSVLNGLRESHSRVMSNRESKYQEVPVIAGHNSTTKHSNLKAAHLKPSRLANVMSC